ncbi:MAG: hypothetical protein ATN35_00620 [Epulopiscium sp. Nele67-Bin004]|nr:MAG: hypothetical protein ATN35_00620 [Epulopiscium sp. Nele67-Bin004]
MTNSIRDNLTKEDIISELVLAQPFTDKVCVLVEGDGDCKLLKNFLRQMLLFLVHMLEKMVLRK